jgi:hypothetical protein
VPTDLVWWWWWCGNRARVVHARRLVRLDLRLILRLEVAVLTLENHYLFAPAANVILDAVLIVGNECRR